MRGGQVWQAEGGLCRKWDGGGSGVGGDDGDGVGDEI